jgi:hypothetical protein
MKKQKIVVFIVVLMAMIALSANSVMARVSVTRGRALETVCTAVPGEEWVEDNVYHLRGQQHSNIIESNSHMLAGTNTAMINLDLDLDTGKGYVWGTFLIEPTAVTEGAWQGRFRGRLEDYLVKNGRATGRGSGDLADMKIYLRLWEEPIASGVTPPCEPLFNDPAVQTHIVARIVNMGR